MFQSYLLRVTVYEQQPVLLQASYLSWYMGKAQKQVRALSGLCASG